MGTFVLISAVVLAVIYYLARRPSHDTPDNRTTPSTPLINQTGTAPHIEATLDQSRDNWEGSFWDVDSPRNIEAHLRIDYKDGAGALTSRDVRLMKYGPWEGGALLWAYCNLRQANRTFRTDRISKCIDLDNGEIITNLETWLDDKYKQSPDWAIEKVLDTSWDAIRVMLYVSKADGRMTHKERIILREAIRKLSNHPAIDDKRIDGLLQSLDTPRPIGFKQAVGRLVNQDRALAERVAGWAESMISSEKTINPAEQDALDYIRGRLSKTAAQQSPTP